MDISRLILCGLLLCVAVHAAEPVRAPAPEAIPARTVCIEPMNGLETAVARALLKSPKAPELVLPHQDCDIRVSLKRKYSSRWLESYVAAKTGRTENVELRATEQRTGQVLARRDLRLRENDTDLGIKNLDRFAEHLAGAAERIAD
jgi:hypothetical protein